jgi:fructoselysine-6-P-deglycase FrlB-like protein
MDGSRDFTAAAQVTKWLVNPGAAFGLDSKSEGEAQRFLAVELNEPNSGDARKGRSRPFGNDQQQAVKNASLALMALTCSFDAATSAATCGFRDPQEPPRRWRNLSPVLVSFMVGNRAARRKNDMARPYSDEIARLPATFGWAAEVDIGPLSRAVRSAAMLPLRAIGSGGSLSAAHALAQLHQLYTRRMAAVATPLEAAAEPLDANLSNWLLSAGGGNVDILAAADALIAGEPRHLAVLCGKPSSPLADLCREHPYTDLLLYPTPAGKDGFLATNSLLGFCALLARAYSQFGARDEWSLTENLLRSVFEEPSAIVDSWRAATDSLWQRPTTLVLHGPATRVAAIDLESKFTEAALGNVQLADYRNFAHGRHHWLAKRGEVSAVLAFATESDRKLAERTLALIPSTIPQARIDVPGERGAAMLYSLLAALQIAGWAGAARGIDPGRPGVPEFGRKLYHLALPWSKAARERIAPREAAVLCRKAGVPIAGLDEAGELPTWRNALHDFETKLARARFAAIVLDYDGTVVDTRERFEPPRPEMVAELVRLAEAGASIGIATGRGGSVRRDLQKVMPRALWDRVLVGYYNGAETAPLSDDDAPDGSELCCDALRDLAAALRTQPELARSARQTDRKQQITLEPSRALPESRLWDLAHQVILATGAGGVSVTRSSHSVDIVPASVSKLKVVSRLRETLGDLPILAIGDRGRWPGNDYELLREPYSLGVDEISVDPTTCWNLAQAGQRGIAATLAYLKCFEVEDGALRFFAERLK